MNLISLRILIPNSLPENSKHDIHNFILSLTQNEVCHYQDEDSNIYGYDIHDSKISDLIEEKLDIYINQKVRYTIHIYTDNSKYPSSIRINKRGKKIFTKKQTKILPL